METLTGPWPLLVALLCAVVSLHAADDPFAPAPESKKGLQVELTEDALALGVRHAAINVNLAQLVAPADALHTETLIRNGKTYGFNRGYAEYLDAHIKPYIDHGAAVYLIVLLYEPQKESGDTAKLLQHPDYSYASPNHVCAFNVSDDMARGRLEACFAFLANRYVPLAPKKVHFIVGNEVNSHWFWYNMGSATMEKVAADYEVAVRLCERAAAAVSPDSRVFVSLDQHWTAEVLPNEPLKGFGSYPFLLYFAKLAREHGDYAWHLSLHPYTERLDEVRFWEGRLSIPSIAAPKITFNNIGVLNDFMKSPEMLHKGVPRRIIFSEQGFHTPDTPDGEQLQAAAFAYAYRKTELLDLVDAFILHRHVDNNHEGGLRLGLWTCDAMGKPVRKKLIYDIFKAADTPQWRAAFEFALPIVGLKEWPVAK